MSDQETPDEAYRRGYRDALEMLNGGAHKDAYAAGHRHNQEAAARLLRALGTARCSRLLIDAAEAIEVGAHLKPDAKARGLYEERPIPVRREFHKVKNKY